MPQQEATVAPDAPLEATEKTPQKLTSEMPLEASPRSTTSAPLESEVRHLSKGNNKGPPQTHLPQLTTESSEVKSDSPAAAPTPMLANASVGSLSKTSGSRGTSVSTGDKTEQIDRETNLPSTPIPTASVASQPAGDIVNDEEGSNAITQPTIVEPRVTENWTATDGLMSTPLLPAVMNAGSTELVHRENTGPSREANAEMPVEHRTDTIILRPNPKENKNNIFLVAQTAEDSTTNSDRDGLSTTQSYQTSSTPGLLMESAVLERAVIQQTPIVWPKVPAPQDDARSTLTRYTAKAAPMTEAIAKAVGTLGEEAGEEEELEDEEEYESGGGRGFARRSVVSEAPRLRLAGSLNDLLTDSEEEYLRSLTTGRELGYTASPAELPVPASRDAQDPGRIVTKFLQLVESQQRLGENCTAGTDFQLEGVVDRYGQERFRYQAELTVKMANLLTRLWKYSPDVMDNENLLKALVLSLIEADDDIFAAGNCYDHKQYKDYHLFCPFAYRLPKGPILLKDLAVEYDYLSNTSEWYYTARKNAEKAIESSDGGEYSQCASHLDTCEN